MRAFLARRPDDLLATGALVACSAPSWRRDRHAHDPNASGTLCTPNVPSTSGEPAPGALRPSRSARRIPFLKELVGKTQFLLLRPPRSPGSKTRPS